MVISRFRGKVMWSNVVNNNALIISISGILIVFSGLTLIFFVITIFNRIFQREKKEASEQPSSTTSQKRDQKVSISEEEIAAISIALDIYKKLYSYPLSTKITFADRASSHTWKFSKTTR